MNEQTQQLIEQLATKLGTTAEHLWEVLIRQAFVSSTSSLILAALVFSLLGAVFKLLRGKLREGGAWEDADIDTRGILYGSFGLATLIAFLITAASFHGIVAGFLNPEFWALKEILRHL